MSNPFDALVIVTQTSDDWVSFRKFFISSMMTGVYLEFGYVRSQVRVGMSDGANCGADPCAQGLLLSPWE